MTDVPEFIYISLFIVTVASLLQSLSGIGLALIAAPILVLIDSNFLPGPILTLGCFLSLLNTLRYRKKLSFGNMLFALYGRIPGTFVGVALLIFIPTSIISVCFSLLIIASVFLSYHNFKMTPSKNKLLIAGFCSGLMGTTTSIGGPPIALIYQNSHPETARAQLGLFFLVGTCLSIFFLLLTGNYTEQQIKLTLPLLPAVIAGFSLSFILERKVKLIKLKPIIAITSISSCLIILFRELAL